MRGKKKRAQKTLKAFAKRHMKKTTTKSNLIGLKTQRIARM